MLLNSRTTRLLVEAAEAAGISRASLIEPLGMTETELVDPDVKVEWKTVTLLCEQLSRLVNGDRERLREVGRRMARTPSYAPLRRLAGAMVSLRALYDVANRYAAPANFPHLRISAHFSDDRVRMGAEIPASYAPSAAFFYISEGSIAQLPTLLELPPAVILESHITPRTCDILLGLPRSRSLFERIRRGGRAVFRARDAIAVLEEQHLELAGNVDALQREREELRSVLDRLPDLVVVRASERVVWANGAFLSTLGYGDDVVGTPLHEVVVGRPGAVFDPPLATPLSASRAPFLSEIALRALSGALVLVEVAPAQRVIFEGTPAWLIVGRDVTERNHPHRPNTGLCVLKETRHLPATQSHRYFELRSA